MEVSVVWNQQMSFTGHSQQGFEIQLDAKPEAGGNGNGFLPMEMIANGIAGCTAMDVISILQKKRQPIKGFEVRVHADRLDTHPKEFSRILIEYIVTGIGVQRDAVERAVQLSELRYCPAIAMFKKVCSLESKITLLE